MKMVKFILLLSCSFLLGHNFMPHHHHGAKVEITFDGHDDEDNDGDHTESTFSHTIDDIFLSNSQSIKVLKAQLHDLALLQVFLVHLEGSEHYQTIQWKGIEIRPPIPTYYHQFSLRAPPVC